MGTVVNLPRYTYLQFTYIVVLAWTEWSNYYICSSSYGYRLYAVDYD